MSEGAPTRESLVDGASLASLSTYGWFLRLAREAKRQRALSDAQLPRLPAGLAPERAMRSFWRNRARCAAGGAWGLAKALASQLKGRMLVSAFALLMYTAGTLAQPIILHTLLDELATIRGGGQGAAGDVRSLALAGAMGLTCVANALTLNFFWWHGTCATVDAETSLSGAILHSVLLDATRWRGSVPLASGRNRASTGSMLFRLTRDSNVFTRTFFLCMGQWASWSSLLQLAVSVFFLFRLLRLAAAGALAVLIVQFPLNFLLAWWAKRLLDRVRRCSDARTHAGTAALAAQRAIRLTATEPHVCTTLYELRDREHAALWRQAAVRTINATLTRAVPVLMPVASFSLYAYRASPHPGACPPACCTARGSRPVPPSSSLPGPAADRSHRLFLHAVVCVRAICVLQDALRHPHCAQARGQPAARGRGPDSRDRRATGRHPLAGRPSLRRPRRPLPRKPGGRGRGRGREWRTRGPWGGRARECRRGRRATACVRVSQR